jgi:hypothetical protein
MNWQKFFNNSGLKNLEGLLYVLTGKIRVRILGIVPKPIAMTDKMKMGLRREFEVDVYKSAMNNDREIPNHNEATIMTNIEGRLSRMKVARAICMGSLSTGGKLARGPFVSSMAMSRIWTQRIKIKEGKEGKGKGRKGKEGKGHLDITA